MLALVQAIGWFLVLAALVFIMMIKPGLLRKIPAPVWEALRYYARVIVVLIVTLVVYSLPQIRDLLPEFGPVRPFDFFASLNTDGWAGLWAYISRPEDFTTIAVTITLAISPILRPKTAWTWEKFKDLAPMLAPNLLLACLFPAAIGFHQALAMAPEASLWAGAVSGLWVYLQWVVAYCLGAVLLSSFYWIPELLEAAPSYLDLKNSLEPIPSYLKLAGIVVGLIILGASGLSALSVALFPASIGIKFVSDTGLGDWMSSTLVVTNLFIAAIIGFLKLDEFLLAKTRCSALYVLIILAVFLAIFDLNDNHRIRDLPPDASQADRAHLNLVESFRNWQTARAFDQNDKPYPIYIVAAQGGGIYAAYHSAQFLAAAQDTTPGFSEHLFAISGVSGGALGAATFYSLMDMSEKTTQTVREEWFQKQTDRFLGQDFLTATVWTTLFTDPWSRVLPCVGSFCPGEKLSRAITFEHTLEKSWKNAFPEQESAQNPFNRSFYDSWDAGSNRPVLLLGTTEVETGENVVISSAGELPRESNSSIRWLSDRAPSLDIRLSTAVGLSARFPGLAPAGWYEMVENDSGRKIKRRLVDGGYFDNSGVVTALAVIAALKPHAGKGYFVLISLNSITQSTLSQASAGGLSEILSPLKTLESVRSARGKMAVDQAFVLIDKEYCSNPLQRTNANCAYDGQMRANTLATEIPSPLGWQLSANSRDAIRRSIGSAEICGSPATNDDIETGQVEWKKVVGLVREHNSCLLLQIRTELGR